MSGVDLVNLFAAPPGGAAFRQGIVAAFNSSNGMNTVLIGGVPFLNLPVLVTGDTINLTPGDVVMCAVVNRSYAIIGRIANAGDPIFGRGGVTALVSYDNEAGGGVPHATLTQKAQVNFTFPAWANSAIVSAVATATAQNSTASADFLNTSITIGSEAQPAAAFTEVGAGLWGQVTSAFQWIINAPGGSNFFVTMFWEAQNAAWAANASNIALLVATATFIYVQ